jgi:actin-related protein 5
LNQIRLELEELTHIEDLRKRSNSEFQEALGTKSLNSWEDVLRRREHLTLQLKVKEPVAEDRFNLVDIPDSQLTQEQIHEKRAQKMQRAAFLMRQSKKQEREKLEKLRQENPDAYLKDLHDKRNCILSRIESRRKQREGTQGRQRNQRRLKIMAELGDENNEDDTFGMNEEDWQIYREIQKDNANEEEEDQSALAELDIEIAKIDPNHVVENTLLWRPPTKEDYQVYLEVDRVRPMEVLFQPSLIGHEQAGLAQIIAQVLALFSPQTSQRMVQNVFLTVSPR